jgi:RNA polymerase sigma-70 factor (ECF subfamily)
LATPLELSNFLKEAERRAFKRSVYHVRNEESALDIVQDSMMKLSVHYGDKPPAELPLLFARILSNTTLDWFRSQKKDRAVFSNFSEFGSGLDDDESDILETLEVHGTFEQNESAETSLGRKETLQLLEKEIEKLPTRQREAFLLRYWEEMDVAETAAAMGCTEGSVKTHCSRACQALGKSLKELGIKL